MKFIEIFKEAFTEDMGDAISTAPKLDKLSDMGAFGFSPGKTDKNSVRDPHYEFEKIVEILETNPIINAALETYISLLIPNKEIKINTKDDRSRRLLEDWHRQRPNLLNEIKNLAICETMFGNGPLQKMWGDNIGNGITILNNISCYNDMSRVYVNPDDIDGSKKYFIRVPLYSSSFRFAGKIINPSFEYIPYVKNFKLQIKHEFGVWIDNKDLVIFKTGWNKTGYYGRSPMMAVIDTHNIYSEIMSSWDTIAKTRQLNQKIISLLDSESAAQISPEVQKSIVSTLSDKSSSFKFIPMPLKLLQQDIEVAGKYDLMEQVFKILTDIMIMGLIPKHLTAWSDSTTTQGSMSSMPPFKLRLITKQNEIIRFLNLHVLGELRKAYPWIAEDATYVFDEPIVESTYDYVKIATDLLNNDIIDKEQTLKYLKRMGIFENIDFDKLINKLGEKNETSDGLAGDENDNLKTKKTSSGVKTKRKDGYLNKPK